MPTQVPSSQTANPSLQATLMQIRERARNIEKLAERNLAPREFFAAFLEQVTAAMAAIGGAVWAPDANEKLTILTKHGASTTNVLDRLQKWEQHEELLNSAFLKDGEFVVPSQSSNSDAKITNPTDHLVLILPLHTQEKTLGVIEIIQRSNASQETQKGYIRFLKQMCHLATRYLATRKLRDLEGRQTDWQIVDEYSRAVHASLDIKQTSHIITNELRRLIDCDRVTVSVRCRNKLQIYSVSNQEIIEQRSNNIRKLARLNELCIAAGHDVRFEGNVEDVEPSLQAALGDYIDESGMNAVYVMPLFDARNENQHDQPSNPETVGSLIFEYNGGGTLSSEYETRVEVLRHHSALAIARAVEHESMLLLPLCRSIEKLSWVRAIHRSPRSLITTALVMITLLTLCYFPATFAVSSSGTLEPAVTRDLFVAEDGVIEQLFVKNGAIVEKGDPIAQLTSPEINLAIENVEGELATIQERLVAAQLSRLDKSKLSSIERDQIHGQVEQLQQSKAAYLKQLQVYEEKLDRLTLRSPISGHIVTWNVERFLNNRPVTQGQRLMTIVDNQNSWNATLQIPEGDFGYLQEAMNDQGDDIHVKFTMVTNPGQVYEGQVVSVHDRVEKDDQGNRFVPVTVKVTSTDLPPLYTGADIQGKVLCGTRALGYVWFHDLIEFVENKILFMF